MSLSGLFHDTGTALDRRSLLKLSTAASAMALLGPSLLVHGARAATSVPDGEVLTGSHWGAFRGTVKDGRFVSIAPWDKDPAPSHQLEGILDSVYSPTRIKYPMVRRAWLEKGPGAAVEDRGAGDFVRVSWDQALDLVAKELQRVEKTYGPAATYAGSYGWKSPGVLHNCRTLLHRLMNLKGGFVDGSGDFSTGAAQIIMPHALGTLEVYEQQTVWPVVVKSTELMVFWGADPMKTNQISWAIADHGGYEGLKALKESGKKVIVIDPIRTETCKYLNAEWIAPRPQTDVALMLGIAHTLYTEKLHDEKFLKTYTTGFDKFVPYLTGEQDGTPKDAAWAEKITSIPADVIKDLAHRFAKNRTMLAGGWGMQRQHHGEQAHWMLVTLASMLGQIGLPGGGFGLSYHYASGGAPSADAPVLSGITDGGKAKGGAAWLATSGAASIPVSRVVEMLLNPGKEFDFNGKREKYPDVKLAYWVGGNPFVHHPQTGRMVEAFRKLETFIVHDFQWTPTARHADIVLPATSAYERNDMDAVGDYSSRYIMAMKKVVDPVFEARSDYDIFADIAKRLGKEREFTEGKSEMDWLRSFYDDALKQAQAKKTPMPDFDTFWKGDGYVEFPISAAAKSFVRYSQFREDPMLQPLGTPSGLIEIYSKNIEKMGYDDCPPHPTWMEPVERLGGPNTKYPLHIAACHPQSRLHSQLCGTKLNLTYRIADREPCVINPADASARGIADGDVVRVFNDRGQVLAGAKISDEVRPGVVRLYEGGWFDPLDPSKPDSLDKYGAANVLAIDLGTSKLAQGNCGQTAVGDVEKYKGTPPAVTVFSAPQGAA
jgi:trimethylamine-N-oxide reductase (cytochrome c)